MFGLHTARVIRACAILIALWLASMPAQAFMNRSYSSLEQAQVFAAQRDVFHRQ